MQTPYFAREDLVGVSGAAGGFCVGMVTFPWMRPVHFTVTFRLRPPRAPLDLCLEDLKKSMRPCHPSARNISEFKAGFLLLLEKLVDFISLIFLDRRHATIIKQTQWPFFSPFLHNKKNEQESFSLEAEMG